MKYSAAEIAAGLRRVAAAWPENIRKAEAASGRELLERAIENSSGTLSPADLRRQDHPYARRHGEPRQDPDVVNVGKTRVFQHSWHLDGPRVEGGTVRTAIFNTDPKGGYLEQRNPPPSTTTMFARHPHEKAARETARNRRARLRAAVRDTFRDEFR